MYKFFKVLSTIILFLFSIHYSNKLIELIQKNDPLMETLVKKQENYYQAPINATITNQTIIPGVSGYQVDIKKSYQKMKKLGSFNESLLVYQTLSPSKSYLNNYDKIIIPRLNNKISLVFDINNNQDLFNYINIILINNNVPGNLLNNSISLNNTNFKNTLSTISNNSDYCLTYEISLNKNCITNKKYTILAKNNTITNYHLSNTKNNLANSNILIYSFTSHNINDLNLIIKYLKNNQYTIVSIDELIKE